MTSQPGKQTIGIHTLPNTSRREECQTMKFEHSIEYNLRNIFLEKSHRKCGGETIPSPFLSRFFYMTKNSGQTFKYVENEKSF